MIYVTGDTHGTHDFAKLLDNKYKKFTKILYLIFDYPHKHHTFKHFEV